MNFIKQRISLLALTALVAVQPLCSAMEMLAPREADKPEVSAATYQAYKRRVLERPDRLIGMNFSIEGPLDEKMQEMARELGWDLRRRKVKELFAIPGNKRILTKVLRESVHAYENRNPVWRLRECVGLDCPLTRSHSAFRREQFEREIVDAIEQAARQKEGAVNYVNFASGSAYQDLIVGSHVFERGLQELNIHLIDAKFGPYVDFVRRYSDGRIHAYAPVVFEQINSYDEDRKEGRLDDGTALKAFSDQIDEEHALFQATEFFQRSHSPLSQLANWFKQAYPEVTCRIFVYGSTKQYKAFCDEHPEFRPDVVSQADFDEMALIYGAGPALKELLDYTFEHNNQATAFMLTKPSLFHGYIPISHYPFILRCTTEDRCNSADYTRMPDDMQMDQEANYVDSYKTLVNRSWFSWLPTWTKRNVVLGAGAAVAVLGAGYLVYKKFFKKS